MMRHYNVIRQITVASIVSWKDAIHYPGMEDKKHKALLIFVLLQAWPDYCGYVIKAVCFITEHEHYSLTLCTVFSKPIRARRRRPAHPCKIRIFTFHCHVQWILIWLLWFNTVACEQFRTWVLNGFVNILRDFSHYVIWSTLTGALIADLCSWRQVPLAPQTLVRPKAKNQRNVTC